MSEQTGQLIMPSGGEQLSNPIAGTLQDTSRHRDVNTLDPYQFVEHTFDGSNGYRDNTYLIPNDRETFYETRRKISVYDNVFRPIVNAMVDPVFNGDIKRETTDAMYQGFIDNCDNAGTPLNVFMKNAIRSARLFSITFIVMDNFKADELYEEETEEQVTQERKYPYLYERKPYQVHDHETDNYGRLTEICFVDKCEEVEIGEKKEVRQYYKEWDAVGWKLYYVVNNGKAQEEITVEEGAHNLGVIPVIAVVDFASSSNLTTFPNPDMYDLAKLCFGLYNKESQVSDMELRQTFAIFCTSGLRAQSIVAGPATVLDSGSETKFPPFFAAPPQDGIRVLVENSERMKMAIKDAAKQRGVVGVTMASSGISKEWDFRAEEAVLKATAAAGERIEKLLAQLFGIYVNREITITVEYPRHFDPKADENDIASALLILKEFPPQSLKKYLFIDIAKKRWKNDPEMLAEVLDEMEKVTLENMTIDAMKGEGNE